MIEDLGTILGVWAHPDDEAYLSAGIMAMAREAGQRVMVVTATLGEQGTPDPVAMPPERLAGVRRQELARSMDILGVSEHRTLGYADGGCAAVPVSVGARQVAETIDELAPDTILTFGPDGYTGHPDHRTMSAWVDRAVSMTASPARVMHATTDPRFLADFADVHDGFDVFFAGRPSVTPIPELAVHARLEPRILDRKIAALGAQASQTSQLMAELGERFRDWVAVERFVEPASAGQDSVDSEAA